MECINKYCHNEVNDSVFCGKCTPPYGDFNKIVKDIEDTNEKLFSEIEWCKQHNMNWEASMKEQIYSHTRRIITKLKHEFLP